MQKNIVNRQNIFLFFVFVISCLSAYFIETNEIFKGIIALPAPISLFYILYEIYRENRAHERALELQNKQQDFILGTASHMAEVAYNKHVLFCEEYINRVQKGREELIVNGPSRDALKIGYELTEIRQKHSSWLTKKIEENLKPFERALRKIGSQEGLLQSGALEIGERRNKVIEELYKSFELVLSENTKNLSEEDAELAIDTIIEKIRDIIGINTLTELRKEAIDLALTRLNHK